VLKMISGLSSSFYLQEPSPLPREGLPYWIFWFLLCIILLLFSFIFLRDKDLRQRLSSFLSGAKRRMRRTQLQVKLNKEKRRKIEFLKELGQKAWSEKVKFEKFEPIFKDLAQLEEKAVRLQEELKETISRILRLKNQQEENKLELKSLRKTQENGKPLNEEKLKRKKEREKWLKREVEEYEKSLKRGEKTLYELEIIKQAHFEQLGCIIDEERIGDEGFFLLYAEIDKLNRSILQLMSQIEDLS